jgi:hypothetical protein
MLQKIEEEENKSNNIVTTVTAGTGGFAEGRAKKK